MSSTSQRDMHNGDLEGLRGIALGLMQTARHKQMTLDDWENYALHTADDINMFLRGLYAIPELADKLYKSLSEMPLPPHMPNDIGLRMKEAMRAYENIVPASKDKTRKLSEEFT